MKNRQRNMATALLAAASILTSFGTLAQAKDKVLSCKTETGNFYVLGYGANGKAALCKERKSCFIRVVEGSCEQVFGCKTYVSTTYGNCKTVASAPPAKVQPKVTPGSAETPVTKSPKVPPTGGIQRN